MKIKLTLLGLFFSIANIFAQQEIHSKVIIPASPNLLQQLATRGLHIDHFHKTERGELEFVLSESEVQILEDSNLDYEVEIPNLTEHFLANNLLSRGNTDLINFDLGDMGGYHTYDNMITHIQLMASEYPDLVQILEIGSSIENRTIYAVKISDNVLVNESASEGVVYYDALTHAREPMSLEASLYYMWWLLENYATDPEAKYLVDHREIYFVPVVNPDGYVFNEINDPNGGGFWRKNRRDNGGGCYGVDLNRNYSYQWGLDSGSSSDGCTEIYRGTAPFSEPETEAVKDFLTAIDPAIAFTIHTFGDVFLNPYGYDEILDEYEIYAEFCSEFIPKTYKGYGITAQMLGYSSSGTTRDYLHSEGIYGWTPEIGHTFWEPASEICDRVIEFLKPMKYLSWVSGNYPCYHDFSLLGSNTILEGETISLSVRIKNRGLTKSASSVKVKVKSLHSGITEVNSEIIYPSVAPRAFAENNDDPFTFQITDEIPLMEVLPIEVTVFQDLDNMTYRDTIYLQAGAWEVLFEDDAENGLSAWTTDNAAPWDTSFMDATSGAHSFADSRYGNYENLVDTYIELDSVFDLSIVENPWVLFNAKWSFEEGDYCYFEASSDGGQSWFPLEGLYTDVDALFYHFNQHWVQERVDLSLLIGSSETKFRFRLISDSSVNSDGFYFDDFQIVNFVDSLTVNTLNVSPIKTAISVAPNPSSNQFMLKWTSSKNELTNLQIVDNAGKVVYKEQLHSTNGENTKEINLANINAGVYFLTVVLEGKKEVLKLIVL